MWSWRRALVWLCRQVTSAPARYRDVVQQTIARRLSPHRRLLVRLARVGQRCDLAMPQVIAPGRERWDVKVGSVRSLLQWGRALGLEPVRAVRYNTGCAPDAGTRQLLVMHGVVGGINVQVWTEYERKTGPVERNRQRVR